MKQSIRLEINGQVHDLLVAPNQTLLEVLRESLEFTGTKRGCDHGACGSCTVLIDDEPHLSCLTLAVAVAGQRILTIEGLAQGGELHPLQKAFIEKGAVQCGFCTPGMILTAKSILDEEEHPNEDSLRKKMAGNLCRCTGYKKILEAVVSSAKAGSKG
jgi:carbon-monoxide dehydrogenase small subunit